MMKIRLIILFLIVFFITPNVKAMSSITSLFVHEPFLWSVEKDGKVSYFFGTVHFPIPLIDIPCSHIITEKIQTSELMFLETLDDATERINRYTKAITASHLSEDSSDFQSLSTEAQSFLRDKKILNTQMTYMGYMLSLMLKRNVEAQNTFDRNSIGILDDQIKEIAMSQDIPLTALDSEVTERKKVDIIIKEMEDSIIVAETFLQMKRKVLNQKQSIEEISNTPYDQLRTSVVTALQIETAIDTYYKYIESMKQFMEDNIRIYKQGDSDEQKRLNASENNDEFILKQRNQEWFAKFITAQKNYNRIFAAVGVMHLIGENNLLDILKKEGIYYQPYELQPFLTISSIP